MGPGTTLAHPWHRQLVIYFIFIYVDNFGPNAISFIWDMLVITPSYSTQVTSAMRSVVSSMASACDPRDLHFASLSATMDRFERMTDHLGARQTYATESLGGTVAAVADTDQVDLLMARIVDRAGLDVKSVMPAAFTTVEFSSSQQTSSSSPADPMATLDEQLAKLRNDYGWSDYFFFFFWPLGSTVIFKYNIVWIKKHTS